MKKITSFAIALFTTIVGFNQEFQWVNSHGDHITDNSTASTLDKEDNYYITGVAGHGVEIGTYTTQSLGMYIAKFDTSGQFRWAMESGYSSFVQPTGVVCDPQNNVIITGYYKYDLSFGEYEISGTLQPRMFIVKYSSNGELLWAKSFGSVHDTKRTYTNSIATDNSGNIYTSGAFERKLVFGNDTLESKSPNYHDKFDIFLAKFDENGSPLWAKRFGGISDDYAYSMICKEDNTIYISGLFRPKEADFGDITVDFDSYTPLDFTLKLEASNPKWIQHREDSNGGHTETTNLAADQKGNVYAYGNYNGPLVYDDQDTLHQDHGNYLLKIDSAGKKVLIRDLHTKNAALGNLEGSWIRKLGNITVDDENNLFLTSHFHDTLTFEKDTLISTLTPYGWGSADIFVTKYNEIGYPQWAIRAGGNLSDFVNSIVLAEDSTLIVGGYYSSPEAEFGDFIATNNSGNNNEDFYFTSIKDTSQNECPEIDAALGSSPPHICGKDSVVISCESNYGSIFKWFINDEVATTNYTGYYQTNDSLTANVIVNPNTICPDTTEAFELKQYPKPIVQIQASPDTVICPDSTIQLSTHEEPDYHYTWFWDDEFIDSGVSSIEISNPGYHKVSVSDDFCQDTSGVQIIDKVQPQVNIFFDSITVYDFPFHFDADESTDQYSWLFEDESIPVSDSSSVEMNREGMYYVYLSNECGSDSDSIYVNNPLIGMNEHNKAIQRIHIYPNPANQRFTISTNRSTPIQKVKIYNQMGQLMIKLNKPDNDINIKVLPSGIYTVIIQSRETKFRKKLIIK